MLYAKFSLLFLFSVGATAQQSDVTPQPRRLGYSQQAQAEEVLARLKADKDRVNARARNIAEKIPVTDRNALDTGYRTGTQNGVGSINELKEQYRVMEQQTYTQRIQATAAGQQFGIDGGDARRAMEAERTRILSQAQQRFPGQADDLKKWMDNFDPAIGRRREAEFAASAATTYRDAFDKLEKQFNLTKTIEVEQLNRLNRAADTLNLGKADDIASLARVGGVEVHGSRRLARNCFD